MLNHRDSIALEPTAATVAAVDTDARRRASAQASGWRGMPVVVKVTLGFCAFAMGAMLIILFVPTNGRITGPASSGHAARLFYLWGISDAVWMKICMGADAALIGLTGALTYRHWRRTGRSSSICALFLGWVAIGLLDPLVNWSMYVQYNPRLAHFPLNFFWGTPPTIEPYWPLLGAAYAEWFLLQAMLAGGIVKRLGRWSITARMRPFMTAHPLWTRAIVGGIVGGVVDPPAELVGQNAGIWVYWQQPKPVIHVGRLGYLSLGECLIGGVLICAIWTLLLHEDADGHSVCWRLARTVRAAGALRLGEVGTAIAITLLVGGVGWIGYFGVMRETGNAVPTGAPWPYSSMKVYNPDGLLPVGAAGYRGVWASKPAPK